MCLGNRAESSVRYINTKLCALYKNAVQCFEEHRADRKLSLSAIEYATCLFVLYAPGRYSCDELSHHDLAFFATFGRPHLEFVCNHEVLLFLDIKEGHFNLDYTKTTSKQELHEEITAVFVPEHSDLPGITSADELYLPTLKRAGHHVLYSLPDFDTLASTTSHIDYSIINDSSTLTTDTLHGVNITDINNFLRGLWLQAAAFVDEHGLSIDTVSKTSLAELRTSTEGIDGIHMHLCFGPIYIQPLCKREIILCIHRSISRLTISLSHYLIAREPEHNLSKWKTALIVDTVFEETDHGSSRRIKLDLRFALVYISQPQNSISPLSTIPNLLSGSDYRSIRARREALIYYVQGYYFSASERAHHHVLYTIPILDQGFFGTHSHKLTPLKFQIVPFNYSHGAEYLEGLIVQFSNET
ncbi:hypothetical protein EW145_g1793 [Phellinidium pouzarii]|uniref:Uncharacterized protein n=1 Tax=Phellinidium pouzarii TaxID=167371 RepID=A0A4S4LD66_9AGAM|nr:hypothetical protein EW145_g1793 [Phellinidium pouzarii]